MRIAIYGGSFNPPHLGHLLVARRAAEQLRPELFLIIPDNIPPHKELAENSPDAAFRFEMCRSMFSEIPNAVISDMELKRTGKSYTADTVTALLEQYSCAEIMLVIGTDMLLTFEKWFNFTFLLRSCTLVAEARTEADRAAVAEHAAYLEKEYGARVELLSIDPIEISSSELRSMLPQRKGREYLSDEVYSAIIRCRTYGAKPEFDWLRSKTFAYLDDYRARHTAGCESEAVSLAQRWGADPDEAREAGILHDITKKMNYEEQLRLCDKYGIVNNKFELEIPMLLHAKTGAAFARELFGISESIYQSIRWHTTARPAMTLLEKIIYMADYIEPTRNFPGVDGLRAAAYADLDGAMAMGLEMSIEDIRSRGTEPYSDTIEAYQWYIDLINKKGDE